jgi:proliferating cell nuclear antigen PCNA
MLLEVFLPAHWFDVYQVTQPVTIGLKTNDFQKVMRVRDKKQKIKMTLNGNDKLDICYFDNNIIPNKTEFELSLFEIENEMLNIPQTEYSADITMESVSFSDLISQLKEFGDILHVNICETDIVLMALGTNNTMKVTIQKETLSEFQIVEDEKISALFSIRIIKDIATFYKISPKITIGITNDLPVQFTYMLTELKSDDTRDYSVLERPRVVFYLAPQIPEN